MLKLIKTCTSRVKSDVFRYYCTKSAKSKLNVMRNENGPKQKSFGQPTSLTHPYLLKDNEITPHIHKNEFMERRQNLVEAIVAHTLEHSEKSSGHIIVIPSANKQYMTEKIPYIFRQNSDFLYLSGCLEPESCLILSTTNTPSQHRSTLFVREKDSHSELWDGPRTGPEEAVELFGVDQALSIKEIENFFMCYIKSNPSTMLWYDVLSPIQQSVHNVMMNYFQAKENKKWNSPKPFIHRLRVIKSPSEVALMQKSCDIASIAIAKAISTSKPGINEHQIFARLDYECRMEGAEMLAYPPVIAGGNRATVIHYINNNQRVLNGEMVLMDAGCECHGYSSDITRTWPISGKFSAAQKALYEAVLDVQKDLIKTLEKFPTLNELFDYMCLLLGRRLQDIGLVSRTVGDEALLRYAYDFCPHHVSHYLGLDVHDTPTVPRSINVVPGMIVTVEPGVYISEKHKVPKEFQGLGIRIEDDVHISENGPIVLSRKCPKSLSDIEKISSENL